MFSRLLASTATNVAVANAKFLQSLPVMAACWPLQRRFYTPTNRDYIHEFWLTRLHEDGVHVPKRVPKKNPLGEGVPLAKGVVLRTLVKKPKKPNSANRKCVLIRLNRNGRELTAYVPGEGHSLQEHNHVLVRVANLRDTPGVKVKCIRGAYDLGHVIKKSQ